MCFEFINVKNISKMSSSGINRGDTEGKKAKRKIQREA